MNKKKKKQDIVVIVNVKKLILFLVTVALCILALLGALHTVRHFLKVGRFEVNGTAHYEPIDLINAAGVKLGDHLYRLDTDEIEERLLRECPFLISVEVKERFPNRLTIYAEERHVPWYVEVSNAKYALDQNLLVVDEISDTDGMARLILPDVRRVIAGNVPDFAESETELRRTLEAIAEIRSVSFYSRLTEIDLRSRWNIRITVDEKFIVELGDMTNLFAKLEAVRAILDSDRLDGAVSGEIYAADPGQGVAVSVTTEPAEDTGPQKGD